MKICESCGAHNSDSRVFCVDCGTSLGKKISFAQEKKIAEKLDEKMEKMEKMYNSRDPLYVSVFDKIMGISAIACILFSLTLILLKPLMNITVSSKDLFYVIIVFAFGAVDALIPKLSWELEKMRLILLVISNEEPQPTEFYMIGRRIGVTLFIGVGVAFLIMALI